LMGLQNGLLASVNAGRIILTFIGISPLEIWVGSLQVDKSLPENPLHFVTMDYQSLSSVAASPARPLARSFRIEVVSLHIQQYGS